MGVSKDGSGRWRAVLKSGREYVVGKTFDTRREADAWLARERAALAGGIDPRAGRVLVRRIFATWLDLRKTTVAVKTYKSDFTVRAVLPPGIANLNLNRVSDREVQRCLDAWSSTYAESTVRRYRATLAAFFSWCVRERMISTNPVTGTRVPAQSAPPVEMWPFTENELLQLRDTIKIKNERLADVVWLAAWTGLRWSELRELRVSDVVEIPVPRLLVRRATPEGVETKRPKSGRSRQVPLVDTVLPIVRQLARDKSPDDLLVTTNQGKRLHATAFKRSTNWAVNGKGRRLHDLRHTAACLWLEAGVSVTTVQAWMGHADLGTTQGYLHYLGTTADTAALDQINARGHAGGTPATDRSELQE